MNHKMHQYRRFIKPNLTENLSELKLKMEQNVFAESIDLKMSNKCWGDADTWQILPKIGF